MLLVYDANLLVPIRLALGVRYLLVSRSYIYLYGEGSYASFCGVSQSVLRPSESLHIEILLLLLFKVSRTIARGSSLSLMTENRLSLYGLTAMICGFLVSVYLQYILVTTIIYNILVGSLIEYLTLPLSFYHLLASSSAFTEKRFHLRTINYAVSDLHFPLGKLTATTEDVSTGKNLCACTKN